MTKTPHAPECKVGGAACQHGLCDHVDHKFTCLRCQRPITTSAGGRIFCSMCAEGERLKPDPATNVIVHPVHDDTSPIVFSAPPKGSVFPASHKAKNSRIKSDSSYASMSTNPDLKHAITRPCLSCEIPFYSHNPGRLLCTSCTTDLTTAAHEDRTTKCYKCNAPYTVRDYSELVCGNCAASMRADWSHHYQALTCTPTARSCLCAPPMPLRDCTGLMCDRCGQYIVNKSSDIMFRSIIF